ncbi:EscU/YscU/HrcU family type III secretion system export apparatus switch protein [Virgibacillus sp. YIM 98842]|jgi:flagellar biosynthesis protein|uniref:EscU/YscU/HrcU family type III secretion system export apparatus switch protein n=1 Tax=Virgibacillus sp. YIM 98842 TaxID=2663533 RepID=UPI0013DB4D0F|nr:EscU/YscU/HrcU family type III secretion system export apparatus switch protein [Virgibacillus sp. YIM 98842]
MKEKQKKAAALKYDHKRNSAPFVAAKGRGMIADQILENAKENNIPVIEDASLMELLAALNINESIPEELYQAVAEVFAFIYRADRQLEKQND